ncbi:putative nucleotidyltransferase substrate binding domain-containing protein [Conexibacter sp. DBS9H8]|uniref:putative nucleotidyltransferase substrate binding domain-containing protein n=1 Tax=Conexibacter sp. DBS9H8 TaxID=2937801 RepID=UPI00200ECC77|nr:putative nucleotidyltransferase substrate binding domain-containing protein [Conexibacter sp. DBS9H8]
MTGDGNDPAGVARILERTPPFDGISEEQRLTLAASARLVTYPPDTAVLVEDGTPAVGMWVLISGSVELLHDGRQVLVLEPGGCFGHPSLLTGMAPAYTVRTREVVRCLQLAPGPARAALASPAGVAFVADSLRARLVRQGYAAQLVRDVGTTPVSAIMAPARFLPLEATVADALSDLHRSGGGALLIGTPDDAVALLTDADIRGALAEGRLRLDAPARSLGGPVPTTSVHQLAVEAAVDMLAAGVSAIAVTRGDPPSREGPILGILTAAELVGLDVTSPIALRHTILGAADEAGLIRSAEHLPRLFVLLERAGVPPRDLGRVLSLQHDAIVARLIDLSLSRHGHPGADAGRAIAWSWLDLGSAARREFTLSSDQDNALAYADPPAGSEAATDEYFARLGVEVNDGLTRCGFGVDHNGVLASTPLWRMSKAGWVATFDACFAHPDESHMIRASVAFDFRSAAGGLGLSAELAGRIRATRGHPDFMRLMARVGAATPVALNRRGRLLTGQFDAPSDRLDIKRGGIIPLVNLVRFHALAAGVTISPTLDRIEAAASSGALDAEVGAELREAFDVITRLRFAHHARQIEAGRPPDNLIDPSELGPITRGDLETALRSVRSAQRRIDVLGGGR